MTKTADLWILPDFLGGGAFVPGEANDPGAFLEGGDGGRWWKPRPKRALVQPPPHERGPETVVWRAPVTVEERLARLSPPPSAEPQDIAGYFDAPGEPVPEPEPEPAPELLPRLTVDRVETTNWRRIELPRRPERKKDAA